MAEKGPGDVPIEDFKPNSSNNMIAEQCQVREITSSSEAVNVLRIQTSEF